MPGDALLLLIGAAIAGGFVRGFAGFGAALIIMPLATILIEPKVGVAIMCVMELPMALWLLRQDWRLVRFGEILFIALGTALAAPLGVHLLLMLDQVTLRWIICCTILLAAAILASGWRYRRATPPPAAIGIGFVSGITGSVAAAGLPPVVLFWLSGRDAPAAVTRANVIAFGVLLILVLGTVMIFRGLLTQDVITLSLATLPFFAAAIWLGEQWFAGTSNKRYANVALAICAASAIIGLPVW